MRQLKPIELRNLTPLPGAKEKIKRNPIYIILDEVLDTYNTGTIFRLADAVAAKKIYLCGGTETPPNTKIKKASVNTWQWIDWEYKKTAVAAIKELKKEVPKIKVFAIEQAAASVAYDKVDYPFPVALVVGNETRGIDPTVMKKCDQIVELPMLGINTSLNVIVALAIVAFQVLENNKISLEK